MTKIILNIILNDNVSPVALNKTNIALVPKVKNPQRMSEYRPISLCNVLYKILSKVLANRFNIVLPSIISKNQSAFVPEHLITDNVLVAFELIHHLNNKWQGRENYMALKLDKW